MPVPRIAPALALAAVPLLLSAAHVTLPARTAQQHRVTFSRDVAPILYRHCAVCHHPGEVAPFPLLTYNDAAKRAQLIATVTASRYMPPWPPEPGYGHFQGERRMRAVDIATLRQWAAEGAPEGDLAHAPFPPHFPEGWQLGTPDLIVQMPKPFAVAADGPDQYMCFDIPLSLPRDKYIRGL
ncbi:MAG TPA: cytochrome c, partial [Bryobacteraceae bacterium]|nr:cytochrome c [Bryobacteraceae bacterium]